MPSFRHLISSSLLSIIVFSGFAIAENKPDIRPGLWETRMSLNDDMVNAISIQMSSLPKEVQQEMQAKIADQLKELSRAEKECITPEQAKKYFDDIAGDEDCSNKLQWIGDGRGTLMSTCAAGRIQRSEIHIKNSKEISITSTFTETNGTSGSSTWEGRWLADNCGSVKPEN